MKNTSFIILFLLAGCTFFQPVGSPENLHVQVDATATHVPQLTQTIKALQQQLPTVLWVNPSATPSPIPSATITATPLPSLTATPFFDPAVKIVVPILLYHHIADRDTPDRYYVSVDDFRAQMQRLHDLDYTPITPGLCIDALLHGGGLPVRPVVLTFDDGNLDVYQNGFPIMQSLGFIGAEYLIANYLNKQGYLSKAQLQEMVLAGWEVGSHGLNHLDLTQNHKLLNQELLESRHILEDNLGMHIATFAYPFGNYDPVVMEAVKSSGYSAAMGLGIAVVHPQNTIFYLSRREVHGDFDLASFTALLY